MTHKLKLYLSRRGNFRIQLNLLFTDPGDCCQNATWHFLEWIKGQLWAVLQNFCCCWVCPHSKVQIFTSAQRIAVYRLALQVSAARASPFIVVRRREAATPGWRSEGHGVPSDTAAFCGSVCLRVLPQVIMSKPTMPFLNLQRLFLWTRDRRENLGLFFPYKHELHDYMFLH